MDVTPHELRTAEFREEWKGYRQRDVDTLLDRAAVTIEQLAIENRSLLERMQVLEHQRPDSDRGNDELIRKTLMMAQRAADEAIAEATARAHQLESDAATSSAATLESATSRARMALEEVSARATALLGEAEERSSTTIAAAEAHAAAVRSDSDTRAEALILEAEREARQRGGAIRSALEIECDALSSRRHQLARDVEALDRFVVGHRDRLRAALHAEMAVVDSLPVLVMPAPPVELAPSPVVGATVAVAPPEPETFIPPPPAIVSIDPGSDALALEKDAPATPGDAPLQAQPSLDLIGAAAATVVGDLEVEVETPAGPEPVSLAEAELSAVMAAVARLRSETSAERTEPGGAFDLRGDTPSSAPSEPATAPVSFTETPIAGAVAADLGRAPGVATRAADDEPVHDAAGEAAIAPGFWLPSSRLVDDDDGPPTGLLVTVDTAELQAIQAEQDERDEAAAAAFRRDDAASARHASPADASAPSDENARDESSRNESPVYDDEEYDEDDDELAAEPVFIDLDTLGEPAWAASPDQPAGPTDRPGEALGAWRSRGRPPAWRAEDANRAAGDDDDYLAELREAMNASDLPGPRDDDALFEDDFETPRYGIFRRRR